MIDNPQNLMRDVVSRRNVYRLRDRLVGRQPDWLRTYRLETGDGRVYKHIILTGGGRTAPPGDPIGRVCDYLGLYTGSDAVPEPVYRDERQLVVTWLDGRPLNRVSPGEVDYRALGEFAARGLREVRLVQGSDVVSRLREMLDHPSARRIAGGELARQVEQSLRGPCAAPAKVAEAVCFWDAAPKNFLLGEGGRFHYVDLYGIKRGLAGAVAVKQMQGIPPERRDEFMDGFRRAADVSEEELAMPFCRILHFVGRIWAKSRKQGFWNGPRGRRKATLAARELENLLTRTGSLPGQGGGSRG